MPPTLGLIAPPALPAKDEPLTLQGLAARIDAERGFWSSSMQDVHVQQMQALEVITERVDLKVGKVMDMINAASSTSEKRIASVEHRLDSLTKQHNAASSDSLALSSESAGPLAMVLKEVEALKDQHLATNTEIVALRNNHGAALQEVQLLLDEMRVDVAEALKSRLDAEMGSLRRELERLATDLEAVRGGGKIDGSGGLHVASPSGAGRLGPTDAEFDALRDTLLRHRDDLEALERRHGGVLEDLRSQQVRQQADLETLRCRDALVTHRAPPLGASSHEDRGSADELFRLLHAIESQMTSDITSLRQQCSQATNMQSQAMNEFGVVKAQFIESIKALQLQHGQQNGQIETLRCEQTTALEALKGETMALKGQSGLNGSAVDALQDHHHRMMEALQTQHNRELEILQSEITQQSEELGALKANFLAVQQQHASEMVALRGQQGGDLESLRSEQASIITDVMRQSEALQNQMGSVQASVAAAMQRQCEVLQSEFSNELGKLQRSDVRRSDLDAIQKQFHDNVEELRRLHDTSSHSLGSLQAEHIAAMEALRCQNVRLKETQTELLSDMGSIKGQLVDNMKAWQGQHGQHAGDLEALRKGLLEQHSQFQEQHGKHSDEVRALLSESEGALRKELSERGQQREDLETIDGTLRELSGVVEALQAQNLAQRADMEATLGKHSTMLDKMCDQHRVVQDQCVQVRRDFQEFQSEDMGRRSDLEGAVAKLETDVQILQRHQQSGFLACFTNR
jgi:hypothetical protein